MKKTALTILFSVICYLGLAQTYEKEFSSLFSYQVKQVDEFIDRFNGTDSTFIHYYETHNPGKTLSREQLIKGLFNSEGKNWNFDEISEFIAKVNDSKNPLSLDFFSDDWYAKLNCLVTWKGQPKTVNLTLKVEKEANGGFKWIIVGVDAHFLEAMMIKANQKNYISFKLPKSIDSTTSLPSSSNGLQFMNIDQVSSDKKNISNYFYKTDSYKDALPFFVTESLNGHIVIKQVNSIQYSFLQIPGWYFETKLFRRHTKNSGWLISSLVKTDKGK